ncbi:MAG: hypothetical protein HQK49_22775 [Oligoflexia bacterium]|nr:hypothetical protein [Oligoflexia bacterium]
MNGIYCGITLIALLLVSNNITEGSEQKTLVYKPPTNTEEKAFTDYFNISFVSKLDSNKSVREIKKDWIESAKKNCEDKKINYTTKNELTVPVIDKYPRVNTLNLRSKVFVTTSDEDATNEEPRKIIINNGIVTIKVYNRKPIIYDSKNENDRNLVEMIMQKFENKLGEQEISDTMFEKKISEKLSEDLIFFTEDEIVKNHGDFIGKFRGCNFRISFLKSNSNADFKTKASALIPAIWCPSGPNDCKVYYKETENGNIIELKNITVTNDLYDRAKKVYDNNNDKKTKIRAQNNGFVADYEYCVKNINNGKFPTGLRFDILRYVGTIPLPPVLPITKEKEPTFSEIKPILPSFNMNVPEYPNIPKKHEDLKLTKVPIKNVDSPMQEIKIGDKPGSLPPYNLDEITKLPSTLRGSYGCEKALAVMKDNDTKWKLIKEANKKFNKDYKRFLYKMLFMERQMYMGAPKSFNDRNTDKGSFTNKHQEVSTGDGFFQHILRNEIIDIPEAPPYITTKEQRVVCLMELVRDFAKEIAKGKKMLSTSSVFNDEKNKVGFNTKVAEGIVALNLSNGDLKAWQYWNNLSKNPPDSIDYPKKVGTHYRKLVNTSTGIVPTLMKYAVAQFDFTILKDGTHCLERNKGERSGSKNYWLNNVNGSQLSKKEVRGIIKEIDGEEGYNSFKDAKKRNELIQKYNGFLDKRISELKDKKKNVSDIYDQYKKSVDDYNNTVKNYNIKVDDYKKLYDKYVQEFANEKKNREEGNRKIDEQIKSYNKDVVAKFNDSKEVKDAIVKINKYKSDVEKYQKDFNLKKEKFEQEYKEFFQKRDNYNGKLKKYEDDVAGFNKRNQNKKIDLTKLTNNYMPADNKEIPEIDKRKYPDPNELKVAPDVKDIKMNEYDIKKGEEFKAESLKKPEVAQSYEKIPESKLVNITLSKDKYLENVDNAIKETVNIPKVKEVTDNDKDNIINVKDFNLDGSSINATF